MQQLQAIWQQIEAYLSDNISLIAVRDKDQVLPSGGVLKAKTPCGNKAQGTTWQQYQKRIVTKEELWHTMDKYNTTAVAMVGGAISGNLEIIDIDVKFNPGIDATLFSDISHFYPALFAKLRIHRTPSGGYHLLYRVSGGVVPGNLKLAGRIKTEEEKQTDIKNGIKKPQDTVNFLETRGEGGYALLPPSMGYTLHAGASIPVITWEERCSLIALCQSYTQVVKVEKAPSAPKQDNGYYSTNPFEDFNLSTAAEDVLINDGWAKFNENSTYIYFTRAGRSQVISASFHKERRIFYIWTTSSDVQNQKWFNPSTLLAQLKFNGDKSKLHHYLVQQGYGKLSNTAESRLITKLATSNKPLPANASQQAATALQEARTAVQEQYPHGIFWKIGDEGEITISRERIYAVSEAMGYRLHNDELVMIDGYKIHKHTPRQYFDTLHAYITEEDADLYEGIINAYEAFIEKHGKFTISRLSTLEQNKLLKSTKKEGFKFYRNCYVSITQEGALTIPYSSIDDKLIFADSVQDRDFVYKPNCEDSPYYLFLKNAIGISKYLFECIGYYAHEYKDEERGYIAVLSEVVENPKDGGGSGKSLFCKLLKHITTFRSVPGSQVKYDSSLLQTWNGEKVFCMGDLERKFNFLFFKDLTDNDAVIKKLFKDERSVSVSDMPKFIASTNYSYDIVDGGLKRRILPIEFTNFFTLSGGVSEYFGKMFPTGWSEDDWIGYDNVMIACIQAYISCNGLIKGAALSGSGWRKQFKQNYGELTIDFYEEFISLWLELKYILPEKFNEQYEKFCKDNNVPNNKQLSSILQNKALEEYCKHNRIIFNKSDKDQLDRRCRSFTPMDNQKPQTPQNDEKLPF